MDTRMDFQRLLEDMDKVIQSKRQELSELDERLEAARQELSEKEASELSAVAMVPSGGGKANNNNDANNVSIQNEHVKQLFEQKLQQFGDEFAELDSINQELVKENELLRRELLRSQASCDELGELRRKLELDLQEVRSTNLSLTLRLSKAEGELGMQKSLLNRSHQEDEVLMDVLNDKLESLKKAIERRDDEIRRLRYDNQFVLEAFGVGVSDKAANLIRDGQIAVGGAQENEAPVGVDSASKQRVLELVSAFREKDSQIELLKSQLLQATKDLEQQASVLENISKSSKQERLQAQNGGGQQQQVAANQASQQELLIKNGMLERELEAKDKQLHLLEFKLHHYETILPNMISDLVQELLLACRSGGHHRLGSGAADSRLAAANDNYNSERAGGYEVASLAQTNRIEIVIETLQKLLNGLDMFQGLMNQMDRFKSVIEARETRIRQLVTELNKMDAKFSLVQQQCDLLRSKRQSIAMDSSTGEEEVIPEEEDRNPPPVVDDRFSTAPAVQSASERLLLRPADSESSTTNECCQMLDKETDSSAKNEQLIMCSALSSGGSEQPPQMATAASEASSKSSIPIPIPRAGQNGCEMESVVGKKQQVATRTSFVSQQSKQGSSSSNKICHALSLQARSRQLESENELLELAMKEILLALRWCDGQCSSLLIDCPSLERLCQLFEARFLATTAGKQQPAHEAANSSAPTLDNDANLFQLIVLKSELDLVRGQNEQLRADVKNQRREYRELLSTAQQQQSTARPQQQQQQQVSDNAKQDCIEASCQTDPIDGTQNGNQQQVVAAAADLQIAGSNNGIALLDRECDNCAKLSKFIGHLSQCIVRIETRVNVTNETYMSRMVILHQLVRLLERDSSALERMLHSSRRECHLLMQQKVMLEARLHFIEGQLSSHATCLMPHLQRQHSTATSNGGGQPNMRVYTAAARNNNGDSIQSSLTIQSGQRVGAKLVRNERMTISLLKSIINCLQARLDFKDERLQQLESLISGRILDDDAQN